MAGNLRCKLNFDLFLWRETDGAGIKVKCPRKLHFWNIKISFVRPFMIRMTLMNDYVKNIITLDHCFYQSRAKHESDVF